MENIIGSKIKKYRLLLNIGVNELARRVNVSGAYISSLENGKKQNPSIDILFNICNELQISIFDLFEENGVSKEFSDSITVQLRETRSLKELLELAFIQNSYFSSKLDKSLPSQERKNEFFSIFSNYIDSYLTTEELRNMPWTEDNLDG